MPRNVVPPSLQPLNIKMRTLGFGFFGRSEKSCRSIGGKPTLGRSLSAVMSRHSSAWATSKIAPYLTPIFGSVGRHRTRKATDEYWRPHIRGILSTLLNPRRESSQLRAGLSIDDRLQKQLVMIGSFAGRFWHASCSKRVRKEKS